MENNEQLLAIVEPTTKVRICKRCGNLLPLTRFRKRRGGYTHICEDCERQGKGISQRFAQFTSRELIEELRRRGYKGMLKYTKVEEIEL